MIKLRASSHLGGSVFLAATVALSSAAGCSSAPPPEAVAAAPKKTFPAFDPCKDSGPVPRKYFGLLKDAKCEQDMYLTMAKIAGDLGVDCSYCHLRDKKDAKQFDFPAMTLQKQQALFMGHDFMNGLKRKDGAEMRCKSCHVDKAGKPAAKFLGSPRDIAWTTEWMNLVMTNRFVHTDGSKVKCKDCHGGNIGTDQFQKVVTLQGAQITLPGVTPFQRFLPNGLPPDAPASAAPIAPPLGDTAASSAPSSAPVAPPAAPSAPRPSSSAHPPNH